MDAWTRFSIEVSHRPSIYYLAYGSNLSLERMAKRCRMPWSLGLRRSQVIGYFSRKAAAGFTPPSSRTANCFRAGPGLQDQRI